MTKEELKEALVAKGVKVHHLWKEERLQKEYDAVMSSEAVDAKVTEPQYSEEDIKNIKEKLSEKKTTLEEALNKAGARRNNDGLMATPFGIIIPDSALVGVKRAHHEHYVRELSESALVYKDVNGASELVRSYELSVHGEGYLTLAQQFCEKKNKEISYL